MKERLTHQKWGDDIDLTQEYGYSHIYKRLYELEDKIENGTLIELLCKVGDKVYVLGQYTADFAEFTVVSFIFCYNIDNKRIEKQFMAKNFKAELTVAFMEENIGEWVFLSRAEAEKKLAELKGAQ